MAPPMFISVSLGLTAALIVGYCVYFDRKRRSSPDFRKRLFERRRRMSAPSSTASSPPKGPRDGNKPVSAQTYFLSEMRLGEELITQGRVDEGLTHFANAVALCALPDKVMEALQATLPPQMFEMLITKLKGLQVLSDAGTEDWSEDRTGSSNHEL
ncbi:hypothetical protein KR038_007019 [Drosophila bunnanda]|nr:hypothetical protein KR038_007019 [Drosophila bunnanda]